MIGDIAKAPDRLRWQARTQVQHLCGTMADTEIADARGCAPVLVWECGPPETKRLSMWSDGGVLPSKSP